MGRVPSSPPTPTGRFTPAALPLCHDPQPKPAFPGPCIPWWVLLPLAVLGFWMVPVSLRAQVAVTGLVPGQPRLVIRDIQGINRAGFTADNPAAMIWGRPPRAGGGALSSTIVEPSGPPAEFKGGFGGTRLLKDTLALGIDYLSYSEDAAPSTFQEIVRSVHFSIKVTDFISWGLGRDISTIHAGDLKTEYDAFVWGASINILNLIYFGVALGNEEVSETQAVTTESFDRDFRRAGLALRYLGPVKVYAEVNLLAKDDLPNTPGRDERIEATEGILQVEAWGILVGISAMEILFRNEFHYTLMHFDLGYTPLEWLSFSFRFGKLTHTATPDLPDTVQKTLSLGFSVFF